MIVRTGKALRGWLFGSSPVVTVHLGLVLADVSAFVELLQVDVAGDFGWRQPFAGLETRACINRISPIILENCV